ncbi:MAG TPA: hemerythrin domain-containing protein [Mycobacteriales bacterium]|jgi:hypothetical protein|nr:hemerythrin domain-containing protein [Mycobacteriales bacterium]
MAMSHYLSGSAPDGVDVLCDQHRRIRELVKAVSKAPRDARREAFMQLRELLSTHEAAEDLLLRPVTRLTVPGGVVVADARTAEEIAVRQQLAELASLDSQASEFASAFDRFAQHLIDHAEREEAYEFPLVRAHRDGDALVAMGKVLQRTQPPTMPPLPSMPAVVVSAVASPITAAVSKVRDTLSSAGH